MVLTMRMNQWCVRLQENVRGVQGEAAARQQRVCAGMCLLLRFKRFLMDAYHVPAATLLDYVPSAAKCALGGFPLFFTPRF